MAKKRPIQFLNLGLPYPCWTTSDCAVFMDLVSQTVFGWVVSGGTWDLAWNLRQCHLMSGEQSCAMHSFPYSTVHVAVSSITWSSRWPSLRAVPHTFLFFVPRAEPSTVLPNKHVFSHQSLRRRALASGGRTCGYVILPGDLCHHVLMWHTGCP
jgi:hypothetical protein